MSTCHGAGHCNCLFTINPDLIFQVGAQGPEATQLMGSQEHSYRRGSLDPFHSTALFHCLTQPQGRHSINSCNTELKLRRKSNGMSKSKQKALCSRRDLLWSTPELRSPRLTQWNLSADTFPGRPVAAHRTTQAGPRSKSWVLLN